MATEWLMSLCIAMSLLAWSHKIILLKAGKILPYDGAILEGNIFESHKNIALSVNSSV